MGVWGGGEVLDKPPTTLSQVWYAVGVNQEREIRNDHKGKEEGFHTGCGTGRAG